MPSTRVYIYYGSSGAPFPYGLGYSRGLDALGAKLAAIDGVAVLPTRANWLSQSAFIRDAGRHPDARKVCIGHSMGCYAITRLAARTPDIAWDLLVAIEPAPGYNTLGLFSCRPLGENVKQAICFRSTNWLNPIGHGRLRKGRDFGGDYRTIKVRSLHHKISNDAGVHDTCIDAVRRLSA